MKKSRLIGALCAAVFLVLSLSTQAALVDRGGGLIYDNVLDVTWLQDANYAKTQYDDSSGLEGDADGLMTWAGANTWAADLSYFDSVRNVTYDDWILPRTSPIDSTFDPVFSNNATTDRGYADSAGWVDGTTGDPVSDMGHMYYVNLGNKGFCTPDNGNPSGCTEQTGWGLTNTGLFTNLQSSNYWSGTEFDSSIAWNFLFLDGSQSTFDLSGNLYAWAVRPGDVSAVPVPGAVWLFGSGLIGLLGLAKRKR